MTDSEPVQGAALRLHLLQLALDRGVAPAEAAVIAGEWLAFVERPAVMGPYRPQRTDTPERLEQRRAALVKARLAKAALYAAQTGAAVGAAPEKKPVPAAEPSEPAPRRRKNEWTAEQEQTLIAMWASCPVAAIVEATGKTNGAVRQRARDLGLPSRMSLLLETPAPTPQEDAPDPETDRPAAQEPTRPGVRIGFGPPPTPEASVSAAPATKPDPDREIIDRYIREKGATRVPTVYLGEVAGGAPLPAPEPMKYDRDKHRYTRRGAA